MSLSSDFFSWIHMTICALSGLVVDSNLEDNFENDFKTLKNEWEVVVGLEFVDSGHFKLSSNVNMK